MLLAVYVLGGAIVVLSPESPIQGLDLSRQLDELGLGWVTYTQLESFGNVLLFVPLGLLIALLVPTRWWWLVILGLIVVAGSIEVGQGLFLPDRVASLDDVIANSAGAIAGVALAAIIRGIAWVVRGARRSGHRVE